LKKGLLFECGVSIKNFLSIFFEGFLDVVGVLMHSVFVNDVIFLLFVKMLTVQQSNGSGGIYLFSDL
jgi:hypothetical protein